jgi:hypothetical protein
MADDFIANPGAGGDTFGADDIAGVKYPRSKITIGADGVNDGDVSAANPLPVTGTVTTGGLTDAELRATPVPVSGTVTVQDGGNTITVDGTVIVSGGSIAHDSATTANPLMQGGYASAAAPASVSADGDAVRAWFLRNGAQASVLTAAGALIGGDATNGLDADVTRVIPGTAATNLGKAVSSAAGATDTGVAALVLRDDVLATLSEADAEYTQLRVDSLGHLWTAGQVAHDSAITGAPVRIGARAMTADITSVASGDQCDVLCDVKGKIVVLPYALNENSWQYAGPAITDTADDVVKASAGAGLRNFITSLTVINSHATVGTVVELKDGSTVIHRGYAAPLGGGYTVTFPMALKGTAATAVNVACVTTGSNTYVNASGYVAP